MGSLDERGAVLSFERFSDPPNVCNELYEKLTGIFDCQRDCDDRLLVVNGRDEQIQRLNEVLAESGYEIAWTASRIIVHGFKLQCRNTDGRPMIWWKPVFPDEVVRIEDLTPSGARITLKSDHLGEYPVDVLVSKNEIDAMIRQCKELDAESSANG